MLSIDIESLQEEMVIGEDIKNTNGMTIIPMGTTLLQKHIDILKRNLENGQLRSNEILISFQNNKEKDALSNLSPEAQEAWHRFHVESTIPVETQKIIIESMKQADQKPSETLALVSNATKEIFDCLPWNTTKNKQTKALQYDLAQYLGASDNYDHSLRVAQFAAFMAKLYNDKLEQKLIKNSEKKSLDSFININELIKAALLHDQGALYSNKTKLTTLLKENKANAVPITLKFGIPDEVTDSNNPKYNPTYHPFYTYLRISQEQDIKTSTKMMILLSHENSCGTGPLKLTSTLNRAHLAGAHIISLCSYYDDKLKETIRNQDSLENVASAIKQAKEEHLFNHEIVDLFLENIPLYSINVKVQLSDGRFAVVIKKSSNIFIDKPTVITIDGEIIDLATVTNLTIKSIVPQSNNETRNIDTLVNTQISQAEQGKKTR